MTPPKTTSTRLAVLESQMTDQRTVTEKMQIAVAKNATNCTKLVSSMNILKWLFGLLLSADFIGLGYLILVHKQ